MKFFDALVRLFRARSQAREQAALMELKARYHAFRIFLENNGRALELIVAIDGQLHRAEEDDIRMATEELLNVSNELVDGLNLLAEGRYEGLYALHGQLAGAIDTQLRALSDNPVLQATYCIALDALDTATPLQAGAKAANLARLRQMGLPVPNGFVCTVRACKNYLHSGQLADGIRRILHDLEIERLELTAAAEHIKEMILHSPLPPELATVLKAAYRELTRAEGGSEQKPIAVSVRSSGATEDGVEHSFAGQFTSVLNVRDPDTLLAAYQEVIASGFSARAISYRLNAGLSPADFDLAVLVQVMAAADSAGVLFTVDPSQPGNGCMLISAVPGLGTMAVGGSAPVDLYHPPRAQPEISCPDQQYMEGAQIARKTLREVPDILGGLRLESVPAEEADQPLLSVATLRELTRLGTVIEGMEGMAQDIEWAYSELSGLTILQARPLRLATGKEHRLQFSSLASPLLSGNCASSGKVVGRVTLIRSAADLQQLDTQREPPQQTPCILVLPHSIVDAARLLPHCVGAIIDIGNPTDHLACIAREYGIPMITGTQTGLADLQDDQWIILDADNGLVLEAPESVQKLALRARHEPGAKQGQDGNRTTTPLSSPGLPPDRQPLHALIVPLNLTDAYGPTFSLRECRSIHDIVRFTHEMAVLAMFKAGDQVMEDAGGLLRPLEIGVPFSFLVVDLGGGIRRPKKSNGLTRFAIRHPLSREDVLSVPLAALCDGLTTSGLSWHSAPDLGAVPTIFSNTMLDGRGARPVGSFNYALTARDYLNLNARVEFHFAMVDAVCGRDTHANYIRFRFKGGGAGLERSHRRTVFLQHVLEHNAFYTTVAGDLITASLTGASKETIYQHLVMIGRLFGFSRFLDGVMTNDEIPVQLAKAFLAGHYDSRTVLEQSSSGQEEI